MNRQTTLSLPLFLAAYIVAILISCGPDEPKEPAIVSVKSSQGFPGDTIIIQGQNFTADKSNVKLDFAGKEADPFEVSVNEVHAIVPVGLDPGNYMVKLIMDDKFIGNVQYTIPAPEITSFSPNIAIEGMTLTIKGKNLGRMPNSVVLFNDENDQYNPGNIIYFSDDEIRATVPLPHIDQREASIGIRYMDLDGYETNRIDGFRFASWFYLKQTSAKPGEQVVFVVNYGAEENNFFFNGIPAKGKWSLPQSVGIVQVGVDVPLNVTPGVVELTVTPKESDVVFMKKDSVDFVVVQ